MYTVPCHTAGLPYTSESFWVSIVLSHNGRPVFRSTATMCGRCGSATGTKTRPPPIATEPLIGWPIS